jgi:hypothetical protein
MLFGNGRNLASIKMGRRAPRSVQHFNIACHDAFHSDGSVCKFFTLNLRLSNTLLHVLRAETA